ncbi:hypothetical protein DIPPA_00488 [Diplonema papillatum]|nr:hypothetical protein DIPPA_00488 [Diplonema papillatum]
MLKLQVRLCLFAALSIAQTSATCSDGVQNGRETAADCGGACEACGAGAAGILFADKFTDGLGQWTETGFSAATLLHEDKDYAESGSGSPAAQASGAAKLTSPVVDLTSAQGIPMLRFQRLIDAPADSSTLLQVYVDYDWVTLRDLSAQGGNDGRWRTEFILLNAYIEFSTHVLFRFFCSGAETTFQIDDVAIEDRRQVDRVFYTPSFVMRYTHAWQWRTDQTDPWSGPSWGPFTDKNGRWPAGFDLWLQTTLTIDAGVNLTALRFWGRWDDQLEVWVNGVLVVDKNSWTPSLQYIVTLPLAANPWQPGANNITAHAFDFGGGQGGRVLDLALTTDSWPTAPEAVDPPALASGGSSPLAGFATRLADYVNSRLVSGAAFSLYKNGVRIVDASYGYQDADRTQAMPLNPVMRLASVDKSYVIAAAAELIADGFVLVNGSNLTRDTRVFPILRDLYSFDAAADEAGLWINDVTFGHLMDHTSYVDNFNEGGDALFYNTVGSSLGHTTRHDNALYIYKRDCSEEPGTGDEKYNNAGYMLLRYFMDVITPHGLQAYLHSDIQGDVFIDHESLLDRHSTEPAYDIAPSPYSRWMNLEHYLGLAATPRSVAQLGQNFHLIDGYAVVAGGVATGDRCVVRNGGMLGSIAFGAQCERGISFAIVFNGAPRRGEYGDVVQILRDYALSLTDAQYGA